ncbi:acetyl-CoA carboxylase biotin carboxylase subunit [Flindersiella endophytica]
MFDSVLIANRGEIACRIARTCRELGLRTVAVYSTADRDSDVVRYADEAVHIGPAPPRRSYLNVPAIVEAAKRTGAEAVHPGYGFLSEDPDFAEICAENDLTFIGPPPDVMERLADKAQARSLMADAGLPVVRGSADAMPNVTAAREAASRTGYPVAIKAVAGGGGRGIHVVTDEAEFNHAFLRSCSEAQTLFGDNRVYLERYVESARHVEVQVLCDGHGNAIHVGERDCSVQRRHQKLIEEAPAPDLPPDLVEQIREAAVRGARAVGYRGAGTFEFLVDPARRFTFMEVNCRIQVEHPVSELVSGLDLVREQILVAGGERLSVGQDDVDLRGVAVECRVNAEDPRRGFIPTPGNLEEFRPPGGPFVRVDTHGRPGYRIPSDYDSLLAKTIVWAPDRTQALTRMARALREFRIAGPGVCTTIEFLLTTLEHPLFQAAKHDTSLVETVLAETAMPNPARE